MNDFRRGWWLSTEGLRGIGEHWGDRVEGNDGFREKWRFRIKRRKGLGQNKGRCWF